MPLVALVCPHCEKPVQIQVTDVARSRACPACGNEMMLQVAERSGRKKRKALLVGEAPAVPNTAEKTQPEFNPFPGIPYDRMKADPELATAGKRLYAGALTVAGLIFTAIALSLLTTGKKSVPATAPAESAAHEPEVSVKEDQPYRHTLASSRPRDFEEAVKRRRAELAAKGVGPDGE